MADPARHRQRARAGRWFLLAIASAVAGLGAEFVWRRIVQATYQHQLAAFAEPLLALTDDDSLYRLRPGAVVPHAIPNPAGGPPTEVTYHVNDEGLRRHDRWPPPPGVARVLFVGDSYTFGTGVADGAAFPHRCDELLRAHGRAVFCINAGVPGHNSEQTAARLPHLLREWRPVHVVLGFVVNDAEPATYAPIPPAAARGDAPCWLFEDAKGLLNTLGVLLVADAPLWTEHRPLYSLDPAAAWTASAPKGRRCRAAIARMHEACRAAAVGLSIVVLPSFVDDFGDTYPHAGIHGQIVQLAKALGVPQLDLLPAVNGKDHQALSVPGDGHPNAEGHRLLAEAITAHLLQVLQ